MSTGHDLIRRLRFIIDHELSAVQRLCDDDTWIGPVADNATTQFRQMGFRLQMALDDLIRLDRAGDDLMSP